MNNGRRSSRRPSAVGTLYYISFNEYHSSIVKESASVKKPLGPIVMITDDGRPVLPNIDFSKGKLANMKTLLREYLKKCYQKSTGDAKAKIPWGQLQQNPGKFIEMTVNFLPEGASLLDPSHIHQGVLIDILRHLKECQDNKDIKVVFEFKNPGATHRPSLERRSSTASSSSESSHTATPGPSQSASPAPHDPHPVPTSLTASPSPALTLPTASPSPAPTSRTLSPSPITVLLTLIPVPIPNSSPKLLPTKQRTAKTGSSP
jgi:hypothetical protein